MSTLVFKLLTDESPRICGLNTSAGVLYKLPNSIACPPPFEYPVNFLNPP